MTRPTDENLMAYADGTLPADEHIAIEAYLAGDAEARELVEAFRRSSALAREAFDEALVAPPPARLVETILSAPAGQGGKPAALPDENGATVVPLPIRTRRRAMTPQWRPLPLAASIVLVTGLVTGLAAGFLAGRSGGPASGAAQIVLGPLGSATTLARVLETATSGAKANRIAVLVTFRDRGGRICREFEVLAERSGGLPPEIAAVACRDPKGHWTIEGAAQIAAFAPQSGPGFEPSGVRERDALQGLLDMLGAGAALTPQEERMLIERGWR